MADTLQPISKIVSATSAQLEGNRSAGKADQGVPVSFGELLDNALTRLNESAQRSDRLAESFAAGADVELHDVVIAMHETQIAFELASQVRNKLVDAYQEIMRMQL